MNKQQAIQRAQSLANINRKRYVTWEYSLNGMPTWAIRPADTVNFSEDSNIEHVYVNPETFSDVEPWEVTGRISIIPHHKGGFLECLQFAFKNWKDEGYNVMMKQADNPDAFLFYCLDDQQLLGFLNKK